MTTPDLIAFMLTGTAMVGTVVFHWYAQRRDRDEIQAYEQGLRDGIEIAEITP